MNRLITFGCSVTHGYGLHDCRNNTDPPSKLSWPNIIARDINRELINKGIAGSSNKKILLEILKYPFQENDWIIILWSFHHRGYVFDNNGNETIIHPNLENKEFYNIHSEYDLMYDTLIHIHHAEIYLKSLKLKFFQFYFDPVINNYLTNNKISIPVNTIFLPPLPDFGIDKAADGLHQGIISQKNMAAYMFSHIIGKSKD